MSKLFLESTICLNHTQKINKSNQVIFSFQVNVIVDDQILENYIIFILIDMLYDNYSAMVNKPSVPVKPPKPVPASRYGDFKKNSMSFKFI